MKFWLQYLQLNGFFPSWIVAMCLPNLFFQKKSWYKIHILMIHFLWDVHPLALDSFVIFSSEFCFGLRFDLLLLLVYLVWVSVFKPFSCVNFLSDIPPKCGFSLFQIQFWQNWIHSTNLKKVDQMCVWINKLGNSSQT